MISEQFCTKNGIKHTTTSPYHPASNGLAERAVQTFKSGLKKMQKGTLDEKIARFLFHYRITPQTTTGISPSELFLGRKLRSRFDLLHPDLATKVERKQDKQKETHDQHTVDRHFTIGQSVYVKNFARGPIWLQGKIVSQVGPVSFKVELTGSQVICSRHQDHIRVQI